MLLTLARKSFLLSGMAVGVVFNPGLLADQVERRQTRGKAGCLKNSSLPCKTRPA